MNPLWSIQLDYDKTYSVGTLSLLLIGDFVYIALYMYAFQEASTMLSFQRTPQSFKYFKLDVNKNTERQNLRMKQNGI